MSSLLTCEFQAIGMWWQMGKDTPGRQNGAFEEVALSLRTFGLAELDQQGDGSTSSEASNVL